jgi:hypothetical protein
MRQQARDVIAQVAFLFCEANLGEPDTPAAFASRAIHRAAR